MKYVLIIHEVKDYEAWKVGSDKASAIIKEAGEIDYHVLSYAKDSNRIVHYSRFKSHEEAKAFFESENVRKIRKDFGVKQPEFIYLNKIEEGVL